MYYIIIVDSMNFRKMPILNYRKFFLKGFSHKLSFYHQSIEKTKDESNIILIHTNEFHHKS